jgi:hypothetical protein
LDQGDHDGTCSANGNPESQGDEDQECQGLKSNGRGDLLATEGRARQVAKRTPRPAPWRERRFLREAKVDPANERLGRHDPGLEDVRLKQTFDIQLVEATLADICSARHRQTLSRRMRSRPRPRCS